MENTTNRNGRQGQVRNVDGMMAPSNKPTAKAGKSVNKNVITLVVTVVVAIALAVAAWQFVIRPASTAAAIDGGKYQAVFFTNGQVYFGKLNALNGDYMRLTDIYYLQAKSDTNEEGNPQKASGQDNSNVQLVKLGSEIHGPDDEMIVNKDQILFFENLKNDSNVSSTIKSYQQAQN